MKWALGSARSGISDANDPFSVPSESGSPYKLTVCLFLVLPPIQLPTESSRAGALVKLSVFEVKHQEDDTLLGVTWLNWVCLAALGILANMPRHANSAKY